MAQPSQALRNQIAKAITASAYTHYIDDEEASVMAEKVMTVLITMPLRDVLDGLAVRALADRKDRNGH